MNPNKNHWAFIIIRLEARSINAYKIYIKMCDSLIPKHTEVYLKWKSLSHRFQF